MSNIQASETLRLSRRVMRPALFALSMAVAAPALLSGCGAVYYPVSAPSKGSLFVRDDERFPYQLELVNLTIASAREANLRWRYRPPAPPSGLMGDAGVPERYPALAAAKGPVLVAATSQSRAFGQLPTDAPAPYVLGRGDELVIANAADVASEQVVTQRDPGLRNTYRVTQEGSVFIPELGVIDVEGKTLDTVRRDIQQRMSEVFVAPIAVVNVVGFNSQRYSVTGSAVVPAIEPVTMQQVSLREAVLKVADKNRLFDEAVIELVRDGQTYRVGYADIAYRGAGSNTTMRNGDAIRIIDPSGEQVRSAQLQQTIKGVELDEQRLQTQNEQLRLQELQNRVAEQRLTLDRDAASRSQQELAIQQERLTYEEQRLSFERERLDQARAAERRAEEQLQFQRSAETRSQQQLQLQLADDSRAAAQLELSRASNRRAEAELALQQARADRESAQLELSRAREAREAAQLELSRARDARDASQFELDRQRFGLENERLALSRAEQDLRADANRRAQEQLELSRLNTQNSLGVLAREHVYVSGEVGQSMRMPMPYGTTLSLADALFEARGFEPVTGDPRGIHVVRTESVDAARPKVYVFTLDARNVANLSAATVFEMRPDDVLYVTPQPVTNWNRALTQLLAGTNTLINPISRGIGN